VSVCGVVCNVNHTMWITPWVRRLHVSVHCEVVSTPQIQLLHWRFCAAAVGPTNAILSHSYDSETQYNSLMQLWLCHTKQFSHAVMSLSYNPVLSRSYDSVTQCNSLMQLCLCHTTQFSHSVMTPSHNAILSCSYDSVIQHSFLTQLRLCHTSHNNRHCITASVFQ